MANVLTTAATLRCGHGATALPLTSARKLTVSGKPVVTSVDLLTATFPPGCAQTNTSQVPCTSILLVNAGKAGTLTAGSEPVILDSLTGGTNGVPKNTDVTGSAGQSKLTAR